MVKISEMIEITEKEHEIMIKIQKELNLTQQEFINKVLREGIENMKETNIKGSVKTSITVKPTVMIWILYILVVISLIKYIIS